MEIAYDALKREKTLKERGLDFRDTSLVFSGLTATIIDGRQDYGEERFITAGMLKDRLVVIVWTWRGKIRRIISMRYAHEKEVKLWKARMG